MARCGRGSMNQVISEEQRRLNQQLHADSSNFGNRADAAGLATRLPEALTRMQQFGVCHSVLDYGTGKGKLVERLRQELPSSIAVHGYDPAVEAYQHKPTSPVDVVVCLDVLEHIEIGSIEAVLHDLHALTRSFCYLVIDLQPAVKTLADGRNAHILLAPPEWWVSRLSQLFPCVASFPVMHQTGLPQKLVVACCHKPAMVSYMYGFLIKLRINDIVMSGGTLAGKGKPAKVKTKAK